MDVLLNLTINGIATGSLIFLLAAGLTLIFGLMHVLNFAHGALFAWGAYFGVWIYTQTDSFLVGILGAIVIGGLLGWLLERWIIQPVYTNTMSQIQVTMGLLLVMNECIKVFFGPNQVSVRLPDYLDQSWLLGGVILIKYRLFVIAIGILVFLGVQYMLKRTRLGLIVRAGVMNKEMVQALGINIKKVFLYVFILGSSMAALGGMLFAPYSGVIHAGIGMDYGILAFIVVVIGGMGSIVGSAMAALLVGVLGAFMTYFVPSVALAVNMLLMFGVLMFRPAGLFGR
ncbi:MULTISPECIES: branched-chain amino acid ABC transporter permease [Brevibacillus]|uniref:branched-chain amino acid ABC transporter permease n=1 Tax=Brevibacillus TaxID=55080 RepID=UPI002040D772|nr:MULTISPECIES: branched-chain amino acid ABC transporter permease [Brevibacillus]MCM3081247.1 branched-chain amino acid ABC transporter permease [Brevibacillus invocatus]MCM3431592.1 branched-chain amino acid ABC transporter permease [Brevibacillus invocatus]MDH4616707.1 branched-chain amino acid ABC transporter permease [Brevibacillus sp. AY1]